MSKAQSSCEYSPEEYQGEIERLSR